MQLQSRHDKPSETVYTRGKLVAPLSKTHLVVKLDSSFLFM